MPDAFPADHVLTRLLFQRSPASVYLIAFPVAALSVRPVQNLLSTRQWMNASFEPLRLVNNYGALGSVTGVRREVVIEGTRDREPGPDSGWGEYEIGGKPGDPSRRRPWVAPYHLRLDGWMWFAAISPYPQHPWIMTLQQRLLEGDGAVPWLLARDPFPDEPPGALRARLFRYRFTDLEERRETGRWWRRTLVAEYLPASSLQREPPHPPMP
ncbi:MAG: hypothetical protein GWM92_00335 [Gemmatimonadetes bacterium]|nr:lipase maturation factor family protein [Gemmatimonadota bacterium]NIR76880.1 lipase maturation factor family protein [Gemmatimonadota bacterium]NIT85408.1 lipase maturation factor family protein [Gemmatimonadota bacterium]NIU29222.1 lipase maturation factor family protein [Gemmatimonadota bacterium]NIU34315.1 hypothetical protein [Gemmatimonadota bacterium]